MSLIQSYKMAKYIFPKNDPGPSEAGLQEISFLSSLEYAINVAQHRLTPELKTVWDNLCTRDVQEPEISAVGIQSTKYDLKQRSDIFKKQKHKQEYIQFLSKQHDKPRQAKLKDPEIFSQDSQGKSNVMSEAGLNGGTTKKFGTKIDIPERIGLPPKLEDFLKESQKSHLNVKSGLTACY